MTAAILTQNLKGQGKKSLRNKGGIWTAVDMMAAWHQNMEGKDMIKQDLDINNSQLENMKHAIGFNQVKVKDNKYFAWRNYFTTSDHDPEWDNLVVLGLAVKNRFKLGSGPNPQFYQVSKEGIKFLENELNIKIIVDRR